MGTISHYLRPYTAHAGEECPICMESTPEEKGPQDWIVHEDPVSLKKDHPAHRACLTEWFQSKHQNCPTCRTVFQNRQVRCLKQLMPQGFDVDKLSSKEAKALQKELSVVAEEILKKNLFLEEDEKKTEEAVSRILRSFISPAQVVKEALEMASSLKKKQKEGEANPSAVFSREVERITQAQKGMQKIEEFLKTAEKNLKEAQRSDSFLSTCFYKVNLIFMQMKMRSEMTGSVQLLDQVLKDTRKHISRAEMDRYLRREPPLVGINRVKESLEAAQIKLGFAERMLTLESDKGISQSFFSKLFAALTAIFLVLLLFFLL